MDLWGRSIASLTLPLDPLRMEVVAPDKLLLMGQIDCLAFKLCVNK